MKSVTEIEEAAKAAALRQHEYLYGFPEIGTPDAESALASAVGAAPQVAWPLIEERMRDQISLAVRDALVVDSVASWLSAESINDHLNVPVEPPARERMRLVGIAERAIRGAGGWKQ